MERAFDLESLINCKIDMGRSQPIVRSELNSPSDKSYKKKKMLSKSTNTRVCRTKYKEQNASCF